MSNPWNTSTASRVELNGGEIRGAEITNDGANGITGHGLLSAPVINDSRIDAVGGTLVVETAANDNDWDGATGMGQLNAVSGDLELRDIGDFPFNGSVTVSEGRTVFTNGFPLRFDDPSTLNLNQGAYRSTNATNIAGTVNVSAGADSTIAVGPGFSLIFSLGSVINLTGNLRVDSFSGIVSPGADFFGGGSLINIQDRRLALQDGVTSADLAVRVQNEGLLQLGSFESAGQAQATDFLQTTTGVLEIELGGLDADNFDSLALTGTAVLEGKLEVNLLDPYVPALGDAFDILSAAGGLGGTAFTSVEQPPGMPVALRFNVVYSSTLVQLVVGKIFSADFDVDGDVDADDLAQWRGDFGLNDDSDADGDGDSDGADFLAWQQQLGSAVMPAATSAKVPEPAGVSLAVALVVTIIGLWRHASQKLITA
jgi:hypothetical protein